MPPLRDQPGSGTDDRVAEPLSAPEFIVELGALIAELEAADGGSQSLDTRIHHGFRVLGGHGEDMVSLLIKEGVSWPTVQATQKEIVPPYSTSLDAALQGEEIVFAIRSARGHRWGAMQRTASGGEELAWAATEPLARRLAALKSWHADLQKALDDEEKFANQLMRYQPDIDPSDKVAPEMGEAVEQEAPAAVQSGVQSSIERAHDDAEPMQDYQESTQPDESDQSSQKEKDWEILF